GQRIHQRAAPEGLAQAAQHGSQPRLFRLLCAALQHGKMAGPLRLHGKDRRPLVALSRGGVRGAGAQAHPGHAPDWSGLVEEAPQGTARGAGYQHAQEQIREWPRLIFIRTGAARAMLLPAAGARGWWRASTRGSFLAASRIPSTTVWSCGP